MQMTSRQRITAALRHREPDRTPLFEYVLLTPLAEILLGRPVHDYSLGDSAAWHWQALAQEHGRAAALRQCACDRLDLAERLGHDMLYVVPAPVEAPHVPPAPAQDSEDPVERVRRRTAWAEEHWAAPAEEHFAIYHALQEEMARRGVDLPLLAPAYLHGVWTDVELMQTMLLEPEVAHRHFALATRTALALIDGYLSRGIEMIGVGGDFSGTRPLISPAAYRTFILPEVRQLSRRIHAAGGWAVNASDGNLWPVIDDFLLGCEVDGYLEIDLHAGMALAPLKSAYGAQVTFFGNMDCGNTLSFATPDEVRAATLACLRDGLGHGGHIFCASNAISASIPLPNYLAMLAAYRDFFILPAFENK